MGIFTSSPPPVTCVCVCICYCVSPLLTVPACLSAFLSVCLFVCICACATVLLMVAVESHRESVAHYILGRQFAVSKAYCPQVFMANPRDHNKQFLFLLCFSSKYTMLTLTLNQYSISCGHVDHSSEWQLLKAIVNQQPITFWAGILQSPKQQPIVPKSQWLFAVDRTVACFPPGLIENHRGTLCSPRKAILVFVVFVVSDVSLFNIHHYNSRIESVSHFNQHFAEATVTANHSPSSQPC